MEVSEPENSVLKNLYKLYLKRFIPVFGKLMLGNPQEYKMLWKYTHKFKNAKIASEIFNLNGLKSNYTTYFFGCASGFYGYKSI